MDLLGNDVPETFLEPMYPGSDDDLGLVMRRQSKLIMTNEVVLHYIIIDQLIKVIMRMERKTQWRRRSCFMREGTAANGDERETEEMEIAQETEEMEVQEEDNIQAEEGRGESTAAERGERALQQREKREALIQRTVMKESKKIIIILIIIAVPRWQWMTFCNLFM